MGRGSPGRPRRPPGLRHTSTGTRVPRGEVVLHPVNGRRGEVQLGGARRAVPGERRPDPGPLHLLVEPHLLEGGVRVGHPEGHPGRPHLRAGAGGRAGRGHPRSISPAARRRLVGDSLSLPVPAGKILTHSGHQIGGRSVRGRAGPAHLQRSLPRGEPRGGGPPARPRRPPPPHPPPPPPSPPPRPRPRGRQPPLPPDRPGRPPRTSPGGSGSPPDAGGSGGTG